MTSPLETLARWLLPSLEPERVLGARELVVLARAAEVILQGADLGVTSEQVAENVETFLRVGRSRRAWRVRLLLTIIDAVPLPTHGRRFPELSIEERTELVRANWTSGRHVWRICGKVRNLVLLGAYGDRRAAHTTGYVPVPLRPRFGGSHKRPVDSREVA